jgi:hypothetical protein
VHLGCHSDVPGGLWFVRWRNGKGYKQAPLGTADDHLQEGTLDYNAAVRSVRKQVEEARKDARAASDGVPLTVRSTVEAYVAAATHATADAGGVSFGPTPHHVLDVTSSVKTSAANTAPSPPRLWQAFSPFFDGIRPPEMA